MLRGFISGAIWGAVFSVGSLWIVSQLGGMIRLLSAPTEISVTAPVAISGDVTEESADAPAVHEAQTPDSGIVQTALPEPAQPDTPPVADTSVDAAPLAVQSATQSSVPAVEAPAGLEPNEDAGTKVAEAAPLALPAVEPAPAPANPPAAAAEPAAPIAEVTADDTPDVAAVLPPPEAPAPETNATQTPEAPGQAETPVVDFSAPEVVELPEAVISEAPAAPADLPEQVATAEPADDTPPGDRETVIVNRLPTVGADADEQATAEPGVSDETGEESDLSSQPALQRYARAFENPDGRPLMSIILITDANGQLEQGTSDLPVPITYAIDASDPNAGDFMKRARAAGQEVVAIAPLAERALPSDVETSFAVYLPRVNEAVAVMDAENAAFQSARDTANQVVLALQAEGLGLITYPKGLNAAMQVASRDGLPAGLVFRIFDEDNQDRAAIKRFLDQAAFRARQGEGVIMLGHDRPETVAAILEWILGTRASTVTLAPVSAILNEG